MNETLFRASLQEDLRPLSALLWSRGIAHRIVEEDGVQVVLLAPTANLDGARELLQRWQRGELSVELESRPRPAQIPGVPRPAGASALPHALRRAPVTLLLIALSVLGFLLVYLAPAPWVSLFSYQPFVLQSGSIVFAESQQLWRVVTPVFLHFGWMHIVFNSLWCWELGRKIEGALGSLNMTGLFFLIAIVSNVAQHRMSGPVLFGGLSGVVYGLLGFAWVAGRLNPRWRALTPATPIMLFMLGWLIICVLGVVDVLGFSVANAAHVGGLLSGALVGAVFALAYRGTR